MILVLISASLKNVWLKIDHKDTPPIRMAKCLEM